MGRARRASPSIVVTRRPPSGRPAADRTCGPRRRHGRCRRRRNPPGTRACCPSGSARGAGCRSGESRIAGKSRRARRSARTHAHADVSRSSMARFTSAGRTVTRYQPSASTRRAPRNPYGGGKARGLVGRHPPRADRPSSAVQRRRPVPPIRPRREARRSADAPARRSPPGNRRPCAGAGAHGRWRPPRAAGGRERGGRFEGASRRSAKTRREA